MFTLFYTFLLIYTCLLFLHAEKSDKRWNHWDSAYFSSLNESEKMYTSMSVATAPQIGTEVL